MFADEDLIPISALQHHLFCPRQCALIHVDGLWAENRLTAQGRVLHERSDTPGRRTRRDFGQAAGRRTVRALTLISRRLGLVGKADQVEYPVDSTGEVIGAPKPVEHKRGSPKRLDHDRVQLAAQALCLEEMMGRDVPVGELFYHATRHRETVQINTRLRRLVERVTADVRWQIDTNSTPRAEKKPKCRNCSLRDLCLPAGTGPARDPRRYLRVSLDTALVQALDLETEA